jgi:hypothetical protein
MVLYTTRVDSSRVLAFFAQKALEAIEKTCEHWKDKPAMRSQTATESEKSQFPKNQLELLIISLAILIQTFNGQKLSHAIDDIKEAIQKKLTDLPRRFIDKPPLDDYLKILEHRFKKNKDAFQSLNTFFDDFLKNACSDTPHQSFVKQVTGFKKYFLILLEEVGLRIEKPDRIFLYAESLDTVTYFTESLLSSDEIRATMKIPFNKSKWDYQKKNSMENLKIFWITCMIGIFAFVQSYDHFIALSPESESVLEENPLPQPLRIDEPSSKENTTAKERTKKAKKSLFEYFEIFPAFRLTPACG